MQKRWIIPGLLVAAFALAASGLASPGHAKPAKKFGPYAGWAQQYLFCARRAVPIKERFRPRQDRINPRLA